MKRKVLAIGVLAVLGSTYAMADTAAFRKTLKCLDIKPSDVQLGYVEKYAVTEGMSKKDYGGFLKREKATMDKCHLPELKTGQCAVMLFPEAALAPLGNSNDWEVQCVLADKPAAGMINKEYAPYKVSAVDYKDMILKCGHDQGDAYTCHEGSNSMRGGEWQKQLKEKKATMVSFCAYPAASSDPAEYKGVRYVCQYYNKKKSAALFTAEYMR
jgi:hypothetical protein